MFVFDEQISASYAQFENQDATSVLVSVASQKRAVALILGSQGYADG